MSKLSLVPHGDSQLKTFTAVLSDVDCERYTLISYRANNAEEVKNHVTSDYSIHLDELMFRGVIEGNHSNLVAQYPGTYTFFLIRKHDRSTYVEHIQGFSHEDALSNLKRTGYLENGYQVKIAIPGVHNLDLALPEKHVPRKRLSTTAKEVFNKILQVL